MSESYFAGNWMIDFNSLDLDQLLDTIASNSLQLRWSLVGNKYIRFIVSTDNADGVAFIQEMLHFVNAADWTSVSVSEFEAATPISHELGNRAEVQSLFAAVRKSTQEASTFFNYLYKSDEPYSLYWTTWRVHKQGLDKLFIEKTFDLVEQWNDAQMALSSQENDGMLSFYIVTSSQDNFSKLVTELPTEISELDWQTIERDQVPEFIFGNPSKLAGNIYALLREALYAKTENNL